MIQFAPAPIRQVAGGLFASMLLHCAASCRALPYCNVDINLRNSCGTPLGGQAARSRCVCVGCFFLRPSSSWTTTSAGLVERAGMLDSKRPNILVAFGQPGFARGWALASSPTCRADVQCRGHRDHQQVGPPLNQPRRQRWIRPWPESFFLQCAQRVCECDLQRPLFFLGFCFFSVAPQHCA